MEPMGIMVYGYGREEALRIQEALQGALGQEISLISSSGMEELPVGDILDRGESSLFEAGETKILMFLGFDDGSISQALEAFPRKSEMARPIFCGLTDENIDWKLSALLEHLEEEHRYWMQRENS